LRSLVKLALKCESAEEMGKRLKKRFDRQNQRRGIETGRSRASAIHADGFRLETGVPLPPARMVKRTAASSPARRTAGTGAEASAGPTAKSMVSPSRDT
jgi:hypothetical protein